MLSQSIKDLVNIFDTKLEPSLDFDALYKGINLKLYLDHLIKNESGWNKIAVSCRRMIICDRELDLATAKNIIGTSGIELKNDSFEINKKDFFYKEDAYESIRYINTCGLISYRNGEYSNALEFFHRAVKMSKEFEHLHLFTPDMTSNCIRTKFELFVQLLPSEIKEDYAKTYKNTLNGIIESYEKQLSDFKDIHPVQNTEIYQIYGHGMASLHHNLAEAYSKFLKKEGSELLINKKLEFREKAKKNNELSLEYGRLCKDIYRQLQSKRALSDFDENLKEEYECFVLHGKWKRGNLMILQKMISNSKTKEEAEIYIKNDDFKLDPKEPDKIGLLYNYKSIKDCMNNSKKKYKDSGKEIKYVETNEGTKLTGLDISRNKIEVAKQLRKDLYFVYRRQAIGLIREDVLDLVDHSLGSCNYEEAINWSERFNCLGLIELSQLVSGQHFNQEKLTELKNISYELKKPIFIEEVKEILMRAKGRIGELVKSNASTSSKLMNDLYNSINDLLNYLNDLNGVEIVQNYAEIVNRLNEISDMSEYFDKNSSSEFHLNQNCGTSNELQKLVLFYEKYLDISSEEFHFYEDSNLCRKLQNVLNEIPDNEKTAILKLIILGKNANKKIYPFLIKKEGIEKFNELVFDNIMELGSNLESLFSVPTTEQFRDSFEQFRNLNHELIFGESTIRKCLEDVKNLFIIPDGELFQLPLNLLFENIQSENINIYFSPSLYHFLSPFESNIYRKEQNSCLWVSCPTPDLIWKYDQEQDLPAISDLVSLFAEKASIESFYDKCKFNKYTHIGFFTHGIFHNHSIDAYASNILFNNSFLTPYDILFQLDFSGVQTVFLGACGVGSNKYTDKNESVGIVTAFLDKNVTSVIAPIWDINTQIYREFIKALNKSGEQNSTESWNLSSIKRKVENKDHLIPFVQYAGIAVVVNRLPSEERIKICESIKRKEDNED